MPERDFKGVWIPKEIWEHEELSLTDKVLLAEIDSLDKGQGCFAGNEHLATFLGMSTRTVTRAINRLMSIGLLEEIKFDGRQRYIRLTKCLETIDRMSTKVGQNVDSYNSNSNTDRNTLRSTQKNENKNTINRTLNFSPEEIAEYTKLYPSVDVDIERKAAVLWLDETGNTKKNYRSFFTRWLMNQQRYNSQRKSQSSIVREKPKHLYEA